MKIKILLTIISILVILPLIGLAQFDFYYDDFLFDASIIDSYVVLNGVDLIWSADTYAPYEYQGRALPSWGSKITVEAIVEVLSGDSGSLQYSWFLEDIFQERKSGYGRDSFYFYANQRPDRYHTVVVQVFNESRSIFEKRTIQIPVVKPEVIIYPSNGNSHFSDQASKVSTILARKEFSFIAKPYFYSIKKLADLTFEWHFLGQEPFISSAYDANVLGLTISKKESKEILEKELWVQAINKDEYRQEAFQIMKVRIY